MAKIRFENGTVVNFDGDPTPQDVEEVANSLQLTADSEPTDIDAASLGLGKQLKERGIEALRAGERFQKGEQTLPATILQTGGQIAGGLTDIIGAGFSAILPDIIEQKIGEGISKVAKTEAVSKAIEKYQEWAESNPLAAKDLEAVVNIGFLFPAAKAAQATAKLGAKAAQIGARQVALGGKITAATGKQLFKTAFDITAKEAPLVQVYRAKVPFWQRFKAAISGQLPKGAPVVSSETAFRQGLLGTESQIGVQAKQASQNLWKDLIKPKLSASKKQVDIKTFFKAIESTINKTDDLARRNDLLKGLAAMKEDYKGISKVSLEKLQGIKEDWAKFVPEKAYKGKPISGAFNEVRNLSAKQARDLIYKELGEEVRQAYLDYGNLKGLMQLGQKALAEGGFKGGFGGFVSSLYDAAATPIKTLGGKTIYQVGKGIELIGKAGAKTIGQLLD